MQVLLPLKEFASAKQRLSGVLSAAERAQLFAAMVEDVLQVLTQHPAIKNIAICSRDRAARWLANYYGVEFIDEAKLPANDLNAAVNTVVSAMYARAENAVMIVHGDLPLLSAADLTAFLHAHRNGQTRAVTIAPDRHGTGTNLLAWRALPDFSAHYGANSFQRHCAQARALHTEPAICDLPGARCDIDEPEDLLLLSLSQTVPVAAAKTLTFLRESGIAARLQAMHSDANIPLERDAHSGDDRERA